MRINPSRFERLQEFIWGSNHLTPMLTNRLLMNLVNSIGIDDVYDFENGRLPGTYMEDFSPSRMIYVLRILKEINGSDRMKDLIERVFSLDHFSQDSSKELLPAVEQVNELLQRDGYVLENQDGRFRVVSISRD